MAGKDCMRFYRRDIMQVWRIPEGSGLCNVSSSNSWFKVQAGDNNLHFRSDGSPVRTGDMRSSYAQLLLYDHKDSQAVLLDLGTHTASLNIVVSQSNYSLPYTTDTNINDTGLGFSRYYLYVLAGDIIYEPNLARALYSWSLVLFICISLVMPVAFPRKFSVISLGLSTWEISLTILLNLFEISGLEYFLVLGAACFLAFVVVHQTLRLDQTARSRISTMVCTGVGISFLLAGSPVAKFGIVVCIIYLALTYGCLKQPRGVAEHTEDLLRLHLAKTSENAAFLFFLQASIVYLIERSLPNFWNNLMNFNGSYPSMQGIYILGCIILVYPILCFGLGSFAFWYASRRASHLEDQPQPGVIPDSSVYQ